MEIFRGGMPRGERGPTSLRRGHRLSERRRRCVVCGALKPRGKIKAHTDRCKLRARFTSDQKQAKKSVAMAPQAPRDLRIGKVTATTIELRWAPPILDGGATVYEYEVIFSKTKITKIGKRETRNVEEMPPVATTAFVRVEPVAEYGYLLDELRASTEYSEFRVRCKNEVGWSEYCEPLGAYETKPAVPPGMPLFLEAGAATSKAIPLRWSAPLRDGGSEVIDYHVHYVEVRHLTHNEWLAEFKKDGDEKKGGRGSQQHSDEKHEVKTPVFVPRGNQTSGRISSARRVWRERAPRTPRRHFGEFRASGL